jgi:hypothetical protein
VNFGDWLMGRFVPAACVVLAAGIIAAIVAERDYQAQWTDVTCSGSSAQQSCSTTVHPESWRLRIEQDGWDAWVDVSPEEYAACAVGDWWDRDSREGCTAGVGS